MGLLCVIKNLLKLQNGRNGQKKMQTVRWVEGCRNGNWLEGMHDLSNRELTANKYDRNGRKHREGEKLLDPPVGQWRRHGDFILKHSIASMPSLSLSVAYLFQDFEIVVCEQDLRTRFWRGLQF